MSRRVILTTAVGYGVKECRLFLETLRMARCKAEVIVFADNVDPEMHELFRRHDVRVLPIFKPFFLGWRRRVVEWLVPKQDQHRRWQLGELLMTTNEGRWPLYQRFIESSWGRYDEYLFCDLRDVLFQADPFAFDYGCELGVFEEPQTIAENYFNSRWMKAAYGEEEFNELAERQVVCSGVVYARASCVRDFLMKMSNEVMRHYFPHSRDLLVSDQASYIHLLYRGHFPYAKVFPWKATPVVHLSTMKTEDIKRDEEGDILNFSGKRALVVHQLDRHLDLNGLVVLKLAFLRTLRQIYDKPYQVVPPLGSQECRDF